MKLKHETEKRTIRFSPDRLIFSLIGMVIIASVLELGFWDSVAFYVGLLFFDIEIN